MHDHPVEIRGQGALEQAEGPDPEPKERTVGVLKLTVGLGLTEGGIKVFEVIGGSTRAQLSMNDRISTGWLFMVYNDRHG